jgi:uncharacterized protein
MVQLTLDIKNSLRSIVLDHDVDVPMRDGARLKANVFRPTAEGRYPVLMTLGPYGKDLHFSVNSPAAWTDLTENHPEVFANSSGRYMAFETPDPEIWVPQDYVLVRVDSRGAAKSPGRLDVNSPAEFRDFHDAIEWAATQPWCNGKVGLLGISYFASGQWYVASLQPPHLGAILPWQGTYDFYRGRTRQGGLFCNGFVQRWWNRQVYKQHGNGECEYRDMFTGDRLTGPDSLPESQLRANREEYVENILHHPLLDDWYAARSGDLSKISIPALVVANYGGLGLHLRGTIEGWRWISSREKWLKVQRGSYFVSFFHPDNVLLQRRFFDRYLKGMDNGWEREPRVEVQVRSSDDGVSSTVRTSAWPVPETQWTRLYLDSGARSLTPDARSTSSSVSYAALGAGVSFKSAPLDRAMDIAGPVKARLHVSSTVPDMDIFATLRAFDPDGREMTFYASDEPAFPVSMGWLRVTHRKLDPVRTTEWLPYHSHDEHQPLEPGVVYEIDVEIWPASVSLPAGSWIELLLAGTDFERPGATGTHKGSGPFIHTDPVDRPVDRYSGENAIHTGPDHRTYLLLPVLPSTN